MNPIEIIALIVALVILIKFAIIIPSVKTWKAKATKPTWASPIKTSVVCLIIMIISLFFLLKELTIIQIFATFMFSISLMILGFAPFSKDMLVLEDQMFKNLKKGWFAGIIWLILIIWVLVELFIL